MNRQYELIGRVDKGSLSVLSDEGDWCKVSFFVTDIRKGQMIAEFEGWYCYSYGKLMIGYHHLNWNRFLHPYTHQSLYVLMRKHREGKL